jgi:hypothetical protein
VQLRVLRGSFYSINKPRREVFFGKISKTGQFAQPSLPGFRETNHFNLYALLFAVQRPFWAFAAKNKTFWGIRFQQLGKFTRC